MYRMSRIKYHSQKTKVSKTLLCVSLFFNIFDFQFACTRSARDQYYIVLITINYPCNTTSSSEIILYTNVFAIYYALLIAFCVNPELSLPRLISLRAVLQMSGLSAKDGSGCWMTNHLD